MLKRIFISICTLLFAVGFAQSQITPHLVALHQKEPEMKQWVDSVFDSMTLEERVGQLFMPVVNVETGNKNVELVRSMINNQKIGGVLYFKGNPLAQAELTNLIQLVSRIPLFVSLDGEWGLSMRLKNTMRFPINMTLGAIDDFQLIYQYGQEVARQCKEMGIHINFAPVLDLNSNPSNPVIGRRSFGEDRERVTEQAIAYAKGLESEGVISVGKHFPGHGDTSEDSHKVLPVINADYDRLYDYELYPFRKFVKAKLSGMLTAHLAIPSIDQSDTIPSSLSPVIVTDILQKKLGFNGLVFTDGLAMKAVSEIPDVCVKALLAGNDILLGPLNLEREFNSVLKAVNEGVLPLSLIEDKCMKVLMYKYISGLNKPVRIDTKGLMSRLNNDNGKNLNQILNAEAITLLSNPKGIIPLQKLNQSRIASLAVGTKSTTSFQLALDNYNMHDQYVLSAYLPQKRQELQTKLSDYDCMIIGIYSDKKADLDFVKKLVQDNANKKIILAFFISPYRLSAFKKEIESVAGVVLAYESTKLAQDYTAQLIYGGIAAKGKLSVTIPDLFAYGYGLETKKVRLSYTSPEQVGMNSAILNKIDQVVQEGLSQGAFPGCQVLVAKDGAVVYKKSFGYLDHKKSKAVSDDILYDLASVTKAASTLPALMLVYDQHRLKLQNKLSSFIPQLIHTDKADLTIKDALFHETGIPATYPFYKMAIDDQSTARQLFQTQKDKDYTLRADKNLYARKDFTFIDSLVSTSEHNQFNLRIAENLFINESFTGMILNKIASLPLGNKGKYLYSCLNFSLLKTVVENTSKTKLDHFVEERLFSRLGAPHTLYNPLTRFSKEQIAPTENDEYLRKQLLQGYVHDELAAFSGGVGGNAGLFSNANDLAKLLQTYLNEGEYGGERYFSKETVRLFTGTKSAVSRRGLGFDKPDVNPAISPTCAGTPLSVYGHTGFTGTCFWVDPDNKLIYIFLSNRVYPHRWNTKLMDLNIRPRIQKIIYESIEHGKN